MPVLETERLTLRPFGEADVPHLEAMLADPDVARSLRATPATREDAWRHLALLLGHETLRGFTPHAVVDSRSGAFLGRCGLWRPEGWPGLEIGWTLARQAWGHGYATEAAAAWRDWAFASLAKPEPPFLYSVIPPENTRSLAVARRIGHERLGECTVREVECELWGQPWPSARRLRRDQPRQLPPDLLRRELDAPDWPSRRLEQHEP